MGAFDQHKQFTRPDFFELATDILHGHAQRVVTRRQPVSFKTLFTTLDHSDAISAGLERAELDLGEDGGFAVHFDGRGNIPSVSLELLDGQVVGFDAIRELRKALEVAEAMAARMVGAA